MNEVVYEQEVKVFSILSNSFGSVYHKWLVVFSIDARIAKY